MVEKERRRQARKQKELRTRLEAMQANMVAGKKVMDKAKA